MVAALLVASISLAMASKVAPQPQTNGTAMAELQDSVRQLREAQLEQARRLEQIERKLGDLGAMLADRQSVPEIRPVDLSPILSGDEALRAAVEYVSANRDDLDELLNEFSEKLAWRRKERALLELAGKLASEYGLDDAQRSQLVGTIMELSLRKTSIDQKYQRRRGDLDPVELATLKDTEWRGLLDWLEPRVFAFVNSASDARSIATKAHVASRSWQPVVRDE